MRKSSRSREVPSVAEVIRGRRESALTRKGYIQLFVRLVAIALIVWLVFSQLFLLTRAVGQGMFPSVKDGDLALAYRLQQDYLKDDVVVYTVNGESRIGRIAARAGDVVMMDEEGNLTVNGTSQSGEIMYPTYQRSALQYPYTVPEGCVFILGDYRTQSKDSRDFGPVSLDDVEGKVITILRRRGL